MTKIERDEALARLLDAQHRGTRPEHLSALRGEDQAEVESLLRVAGLLWEAAQEAPPLESDRVAAMLGLVPDPQFALDPKALARARRAAGLQASQLAARLVARGWEVGPGEVFRWETGSVADVAPALIKAIAEVSGVDVERLATAHDPTPAQRSLDALTRSPRFRDLAQRWARTQGTSPQLAASALQARMLATVHRGDQPDEEQMLSALAELVAAMEAGGDATT